MTLKTVTFFLLSLLLYFALFEVLGAVFPNKFGLTPFDYIRGWFGKCAAIYFEWRMRRQKFVWQCLRDGGGGVLWTPKVMTEEKAIAWLIKRTNAEIFFVDKVHHSILYRSRP